MFNFQCEIRDYRRSIVVEFRASNDVKWNYAYNKGDDRRDNRTGRVQFKYE